MKKTPNVSILLLWLLSISGREDVQTSESPPAPKISLIPMWRILLRGNATIVCKAPLFPMFHLYLEKDAQNLIIPTEGINGVAYFLITNVSAEHGGMYKCCYNSSSLSHSKCSGLLELLITDPDLPRPNISLTPRKMIHLGITVTFQCSAKGPIQGFYLHKNGNKLDSQSVKLDEDSVIFSFTDVKQTNGGRYHCSYKSSSYPFISESSNEVELFVVDPTFPRPTISPYPMLLVTPGGNITVTCKSKGSFMRFYLQKSGDEMPQQSLETKGTMVKFHIKNASESHTGEYSCRYSTLSEPFVVSKMSNLTQLVITVPHLPKPNISLIPYGIAELASNIRIECTANRSGSRFYLYESRTKKQLQIVITAGSMVYFPFNNLTKGNGGSFCCSYMNQSEFFTSSETSDDVTLLVLDTLLPKPNILPKNMEWIPLKRNISITCQCQYLAAKFFLQKEDDQMPFQTLKAKGTMATFIISNATSAHEGKYKCSYSSTSYPFAISSPSDFVTIQITDPTLLKPSISLSPKVMVILGSSIIIPCTVHDLNNTFHLNSTFYLYKIGYEKETQAVKPDNDTAMFPINNAMEKHGGEISLQLQTPTSVLDVRNQ
ncbi:immunoglobulin superfamily member 1-like [Sceloporus undulatus]|uniref:immunoglobulin superfamily member 1-like n=1 Tax=Sceloporus undulatus TaxID=8520 RepID=UPI001C4ABFA8|nr:immunoglobulin superfamily member 1-like [Sceloporus undulatus]